MFMKSVLVYGDIMLDTYETVQPVKLSQEAPVLVFHTQKTTYELGGAANAAQYCKQQGASVSLAGIVALDATRDQLEEVLSKRGLHSVLFTVNRDWCTIEKKRLIDATTGQQLLRVDREGILTLKPNEQRYIQKELAARAPKYDVLLVSDYGKGNCHPEVLGSLMEAFQDKFIVVNGKPQNIPLYYQASLLVMNAEEARTALQGTTVPVEELAASLSGVSHTDCLVTAGKMGMWYFNRKAGGCSHIPAASPPGKVMDITGAGDMICASIASRGIVTPKVLQMASRNAAEAIVKGRAH